MPWYLESPQYQQQWYCLNRISRSSTIRTKQGKSEGFDSCDRPSNLAQIWSKSSIFQPVWPWNLIDDLEIWWMTLKFDGWPRKILGHIFYTTSSFVHHIKSFGEFKLKLQSGNGQFRSKLAIFLSRVTFKFDGWPWKTIGHLFYTLSSFVHHFKTMVEFKLELQSGNSQFGSKSAIFCPVWPWNLMDDLGKKIGHLFYTTTSSFVHHFKAMGKFKLEIQSGNAQFGSKSAIFCPVWPWNLTDDLEKQ